MRKWFAFQVLFWTVIAIVQAQSNGDGFIPTSSNAANSLSFQIKTLRELGTFFPSKDPDSVFLYAKHAIDQAKAEKDPLATALAKRRMGEVFYLQGVYDYSMAYLSEALEELKLLNANKEVAKTLLSIGAADQFHDLWDQAILNYQEALGIFQDLSHQEGIAETYGLIGHYYEKLELYDSAFHYQNKALDIYERLDEPYGMAIIYDNLGSIYEDLEDFDMAYDYFLLSAKYDTISENIPALVNTLNNIGDTYRKRRNYEKALTYTYLALNIALREDLNYEVLSAYNDLAKLNRSFGNFEEALNYYDSARAFSEHLFNMQIASQIANFQTLFNTRQKEQEIALLESRQQIAKQTRNSLILGSAFLFITSIIIIRQQRMRNKRDKEFFAAERHLDEEKLKNEQLQKEKLAAELENKRLKEEQFYHELESRSQDLTAKTLHIIQKNRILKELQEEVKVVKSKDRLNKRQFDKIGELIDESFDFDKDWEEFQSRFDQVHARFLKALNEKHGKLSEAEVRLSTLIRMQLPSKDISTILGISPDSLRIARHRLKKKLGLEKSQKLQAYLEQFT